MRILYIDVDSLRPDHLGCLGYRRNTSPNIDRIAEQGLVLKNLYASDVPCLPSRTAFFGGKFGTRSGVINHGGICADLPVEGHDRDFRTKHAENSLGAQLSNRGYHTCSISPFPRRHSAYQMYWGFREYFDTGRGGVDNADEVFEPAADWLERNGAKEDWFLHVNFWDPHTPYDSPRIGGTFEQEPIDAWVTEDILKNFRASYGPHSAREVVGIEDKLPDDWLWGRGSIQTLEDVKAHIDGYDSGVFYCDRYIGFLCEKLHDIGVQEETAIIISADHGENLGELNVWGDHQTADEFTCHIPGIIYWPGMVESAEQRSGSAVGRSASPPESSSLTPVEETSIYPGDLVPSGYDGLAYHLDLAESILELAGCPNRESDGMSLVAAIREGRTLRKELYLSQGAWSLQRSLRWGKWICIQTVHTGQKDFPETMLFDLEADPHETTNLVSHEAGLASEAKAKISKHFRSLAECCPLGDPFEVVLSEGGPHHAREGSRDWGTYLTRLDETGRSEHANWLRKNGGSPRVCPY